MLAGKGVILGEIFTMRAKTTWYKKANEINANTSDQMIHWLRGDEITEEDLGKTLLGKDVTYALLAMDNPRCPVSAMIKLLRRRKKDVISKEVVAAKRNCPSREKFLWRLYTEKAPQNIAFFGFYKEKDPEIRYNKEIREIVKNKLLTYIFDYYKSLSNLSKPSFLNSRMRTLLEEFSDDFEISIIIDEIDKQIEKRNNL